MNKLIIMILLVLLITNNKIEKKHLILKNFLSFKFIIIFYKLIKAIRNY